MTENWWSGTLPNWVAIPAAIASVLLGVSVSGFYRLGVVGNVVLTVVFMAVLGVAAERALARFS